MPETFYCYKFSKSVTATVQEDGNYLCDECHEPFVEIREQSEPTQDNANINININNDINNTVSYRQLPNGGMVFSFTSPRATAGPRIAGNFINNILESLFNTQNRFAGDYYYGDLNQLLDVLMRNDPNHYGPPPTSKDYIDNLVHRHPTAAELKNDPVCSVCDCDITKDDTVVCLPCKHIFHPDCILPWIKKHNTCPTCRETLPEAVDDDDIYHDDDHVPEGQQTA